MLSSYRKNQYHDIVKNAIIVPSHQNFLAVLRPRAGAIYVVCQHGDVFSFILERIDEEKSNLVQSTPRGEKTIFMSANSTHVEAMLDAIFYNLSSQGKKKQRLLLDLLLAGVLVLGVVMGVGLQREYGINTSSGLRPGILAPTLSGVAPLLSQNTTPSQEPIPTFSSPAKPIELSVAKPVSAPSQPMVSPVPQVAKVDDGLTPEQRVIAEKNLAETNRVAGILTKIKDALDKQGPLDPALLNQLPDVLVGRLKQVQAIKEALAKFDNSVAPANVTTPLPPVALPTTAPAPVMPAVEPTFTPEVPSGSPLFIPPVDKFGIPTLPQQGSSILNSRTKIILPTPGGGEGINSMQDLAKFGLKP